jgi:hypothetical protein
LHHRISQAAAELNGCRFGFTDSSRSTELKKMTSSLLRTCALVACLAATSVASAAEPLPATTHYRAKQVLGTKILIQGDTAIGTVDDIVFDDAGTWST